MGLGIDILMFLVTCLLLLAGFPVAFTLAGVALWFAIVGTMTGAFDFAFVSALPQRIFGTMTNTTLIAVPLFVFMGVALERARIAEELLTAMGQLFGSLKGGLGISVTIVGALLAASTGIVGATVVTMGLLSLPTMLKRGYDPALATGTICAAGTLGQIIPPSIVLVLLGDVMSNAYQTAQLEQGIFSPDTVSVGDLFAGALFPGLMLVGLYVLYQLLNAVLWPSSAPALAPQAHDNASESRLLGGILRALAPPLILIIAVLGSILGGIATPTEAAAIGALGALLLAGYRLGSAHESDEKSRQINVNPQRRRQISLSSRIPVLAAAVGLCALIGLSAAFDLRVARSNFTQIESLALIASYVAIAAVTWGTLVSVLRTWNANILQDVMRNTTQITAMVFAILIGAALFSLVFRGLGGDETVEGLLQNIPGGVFGAIVAVMLVMFVLGFFLDFIEITFVVVPIVSPVLLQMGVDPVWLGVMMAINLQTSFLTPPFGFALFYLRGVAPDQIATSQIYSGVIPFVLIQLAALFILSIFPSLATWLPSVLY